MLKKMTYSMLVSGLLLASFGASANSPYPAESDVLDYGARIAMKDSRSPFPSELDVVDYGARIASNPYPEQSDVVDYGVRIATQSR